MVSLIILIRYYSWINLGGIKGGFMRLDTHKRFHKVIETNKVTETHTEQQPTALTIRLNTIGQYNRPNIDPYRSLLGRSIGVL